MISSHAPPVLPSWSDRVVAAVAGLGMFLAALDISVNVALPSIANGLNADLQGVQWVIVAFIATRAGLVMGAGSFADRFGLRRVFIFGAVSYLIAMVTISLSPNLESVVGFRVLQGFGAGSFFAVSPALAARVFPADRRGLAMGFATASQALGMLAGTLGAGLLIQWFGWQVVFWGRIPFVLLALLLAVLFMSLDRISRGQGPSGDATAGAETAGSGFDAIGAITLMGALLCLVIGLRLARSEGWDFPVALALLCLAPVLAAGFWYTEGRAAWPVLPRWLLKNRGFIGFLGQYVFGPLSASSWCGLFSLSTSMLGWEKDRDHWASCWLPWPFSTPAFPGLEGGCATVWGPAWSGCWGWQCWRRVCFSSVLPARIPQLSQRSPRNGGGGVGAGSIPIGGLCLDVEQRPNRPHGHRVSGPFTRPSRRDGVLSVAIVGGILALSQEYHLADLSSEGINAVAGQTQAFVLAFRDVFRLGAAVAGLGMMVFALAGEQGRRRSRDQGER